MESKIISRGLLFLLLSLMYLPGAGQERAHIGFSFGGMLLAGGSGFVFEIPNEQPHREYGLSAGLSVYLPLNRDLHIITGANAQYERSHFHVGLADATDTEYWNYGYIQVPILLNHMGIRFRNKMKIKEYFGIGLNFGNQLQASTGQLTNQPFTYSADIRQKWDINPEFIMGVGLGGKYHRYGIFHWQVGLHIDMFPNQIFTATIAPVAGADVQTEVRELRGVKGMISLLYFPRIRINKRQCYRN